MSGRGFRAKGMVSAVIFSLICAPLASYAWGDEHRGGHYRYHDHPRFGMRIEMISHEDVPVFVGGTRYYYYDGLYYAPSQNAYVVVSPPIGAVVPAIPPDYTRITINGVTYYTDNGVYYVFTPYGYQVVTPPLLQPVSRQVIMTPAAEVVAVPQNQTKIAEGAGLGGILGMIIGGIIGHQTKGHHDMGGALIGGVTGAAIGGTVGAQIPNQNRVVPVTVVQPAPVIVNAPPVVAQVPAPVTAEESFTINVPNGKGGFTPVVLKRMAGGFVGPQGEYYKEFPKIEQLRVMYAK
ncbi:MAG: hypothetical protein HQL23_06070 [Candidatus Omnitrophica bacterium]|nr:hypothetical protein [Candidatus Omnitrophota bacterium]